MMVLSGYVAGTLSDYLIKAGYSLTLVRKVMQVKQMVIPLLMESEIWICQMIFLRIYFKL
ncbi:unnamed protein product [Rhodiola kirilowii]